MRNNLFNIEKNLRSIAKRYKSVKYKLVEELEYKHDFGYDTKGNNVRGGLGLRIIY